MVYKLNRVPDIFVDGQIVDTGHIDGHFFGQNRFKTVIIYEKEVKITKKAKSVHKYVHMSYMSVHQYVRHPTIDFKQFIELKTVT